MRLVAALAFVAGFASDASAGQPFSAAVSGYSTVGCYFLAGPVYSPSVEWIVEPPPSPFATFAGDVQTIDSPDGETVLALIRTAGARGVRIVHLEFDANPRGNETRTAFFDGLPEAYALGSMTVAKDGRVFVSMVLSRESGAERMVAVISRNGSVDDVVSLDGAIGNMAIAADGCTLFYADANVIRRVNMCTGASLQPFATVGSTVTDVAVLSDGDVLATTNGAVQRFSAGGSVVRSFVLQNVDQYDVQAVGVSTDEAAVVVAAMGNCENRGQIMALSLADGRELWRQETGWISTATGLVVGPAAVAVPLLSPVALGALVIALAAVALAVLRC